MILIDIETTSVLKNACVLSIGALAFNPNGTVGDLKNAPRFQVHIELVHQIRMGRDYDLGTIKWLRDQPEEVRKSARKSASSKVTLSIAFKRLIDWLHGLSEYPGNIYVRGTNFEGVILPDIEKMIGIKLPFNYAGYNDIRTLIRDYVNTNSSYVRADQMSEEALAVIDRCTKHIAIDDCMIDAVQILEGRRIRDLRIFKHMYTDPNASTEVKEFIMQRTLEGNKPKGDSNDIGI